MSILFRYIKIVDCAIYFGAKVNWIVERSSTNNLQLFFGFPPLHAKGNTIGLMFVTVYYGTVVNCKTSIWILLGVFDITL